MQVETQLKSKKITLATLKSFIKKSSVLYVEIKSNFDGMTDGVQKVEKNFREVPKENAIGHKGVWCVGGSRDYFEYKETDKMIGIEVSNCCGVGILWTNKAN